MLGKGSALSIAMWFGLRCEIAKLYAIVTEHLQQQFINVAEDYITTDAIKKIGIKRDSRPEYYCASSTGAWKSDDRVMRQVSCENGK